MRKKVREARLLAEVSPQKTLEMGFGMMAFARDLAKAADDSRS